MLNSTPTQETMIKSFYWLYLRGRVFWLPFLKNSHNSESPYYSTKNIFNIWCSSQQQPIHVPKNLRFLTKQIGVVKKRKNQWCDPTSDLCLDLVSGFNDTFSIEDWKFSLAVNCPFEGYFVVLGYLDRTYQLCHRNTNTICGYFLGHLWEWWGGEWKYTVLISLGYPSSSV